MAGNKKISGKRGGCGKREGKPTLKAVQRALICKSKKSQLSAGTGTARSKQNHAKARKNGSWEVSDHLSAKARAIQLASSSAVEVVIQPGMLKGLNRNSSSLSGSAKLKAVPGSSINHIKKSMKRQKRRIDDDPPLFSNVFSALSVMEEGPEDDEEPAKIVIAPGRLQLPLKAGLSTSCTTDGSGISETARDIVRESNSTYSGQVVIDDNDI